MSQAWIAAALVLALPPPATDGLEPLAGMRAPRGLTADDVARRAAASSPDVRAEARRADAAEARRSEAAAGYWPRFTALARYTRLSALPPAELADPRISIVGRIGPPGPVLPGDDLQAFTFPPLTVPVNQTLTQASLTVPVSDYVLRVSHQLAAATHAANAAHLEARATRLQAAAEARVTYYQWIRARGQAVVARRTLVQTADHLEDAHHLFDAGVVARADLLRAEAQLRAAELVQLRADDGTAMAEERLRVAMHEAPGPSYEVGEDVTAALPALSEELSALVDEAFARRLELRAFIDRARSAGAGSAAARAGQWPRLELFGDAVYANPNPRVFPAQQKFDTTWDVGATLSWSPTDIPGARASARARAAEEAELDARRQALLDGVRLEVREAWQAAREADVALGKAQQELVLADEGYRVRRELFLAGKATLLEVDEAQIELTRARIEMVNARVDARVARVRLAHATGRDADIVAAP